MIVYLESLGELLFLGHDDVNEKQVRWLKV